MLPKDIWKNIKVVFFDAEGTIFLMQPSVGYIYKQVCKKYGLNFDPQALEQSFKKAFKAYLERKKKGKVKFSPEGCLKEWKRIFMEATSPFGEISEPEKAFKECYQAFASPEAFKPVSGLTESLAYLRSSKRKLGIISNWDERLYSLLKAYSLEKFFEKVFVSCEIGVAKPSTEIFKIACNYFDINPNQALMIGDSLEEDVLAARKAGLWALHYSGGKIRNLFP